MTHLDPDPYHRIRAGDRDVLLAAALLDRERDTPPAAADVRRATARLTDRTVDRTRTFAALERLEARGLIDRIDDMPDGRERGVRPTDDGRRALARGAARLDAAAGDTRDAATALAEVTGEDRERFAADDKEIPDIDDLDSAVESAQRFLDRVENDGGGS